MAADGRVHGHNADVQFRSASMTKAMLMVAVLRGAATRPLTSREKRWLGPMITESDNDAGRKVYRRVGDVGLSAVASAARMRHFLPVGALFEARITAADQARFFLRIDRLVPKRHRDYARALLAGIVGPQRWGIAPVAAAPPLRRLLQGGLAQGPRPPGGATRAWRPPDRARGPHEWRTDRRVRAGHPRRNRRAAILDQEGDRDDGDAHQAEEQL